VNRLLALAALLCVAAALAGALVHSAHAELGGRPCWGAPAATSGFQADANGRRRVERPELHDVRARVSELTLGPVQR
jgi:hypothetical protein